MNLRQAAQQALEAMENAGEAVYAYGGIAAVGSLNTAAQALRAALAEPQTTHWEGCEAVHPECRKPEQKAWFTIPEANEWAAKLPQPEHEVKNLSNYEFKTYKTGGAELEAGFYSTDELRDLVKHLDKMNAATERHMRKMK